MLLPQRSKIYHPSTAPFVNSDTFMRQPYYLIHASLGFKDPAQFQFYLTGHAEEQLEFKQKPPSAQGKGKMPRTFSHNSQMNVNSSVPFYPGKGKVMQNPANANGRTAMISKPVMQQMSTYKGMDKKFPTSVSHGMLAGMGNPQNVFGPPPGLEKSMMSQSNVYRHPIEEVSDGWSHPFQQDVAYQGNPAYLQWPSHGSQMIPSALQGQHPGMRGNKQKLSSMKGSMSTEFNYNFGSKLIAEPEDRFGCGFLEHDSDSDDNKNSAPQHVAPKDYSKQKYAPPGLKK
jgi:hypothetical protein